MLFQPIVGSPCTVWIGNLPPMLEGEPPLRCRVVFEYVPGGPNVPTCQVQFRGPDTGEWYPVGPETAVTALTCAFAQALDQVGLEPEDVQLVDAREAEFIPGHPAQP